MTESAVHSSSAREAAPPAPPVNPPEAPPASGSSAGEVVAPEREQRKARMEVDLKTLKAGDTIFYFQAGGWKAGVLDAPPVRERGVILMTVGGSEKRSEVAPRRVEFPLGAEVAIGGRKYVVANVYPGENGEPLYDLFSTTLPADKRRGVGEETLKGRDELEGRTAGSGEPTETAVEKEKEEGGAERKEHEGIADLPWDIFQEMLLANPEKVKAVMEEAYAVLYTPERNQTRLENLLRTFFHSIDVDVGKDEELTERVLPRGARPGTALPDRAGLARTLEGRQLTLRQRLRRAGIEDWESFVKRFEGPLAEKFAGVLLQAADSELRAFLSQKIGDIKKLSGDKRTWGEFVKDSIVDYSALARMKGAVGLRGLANIMLVGGAGVAAGIGVNLIPFLPGGAKALAAGGVVGFVKGLTQRWMGKDKGYFQEEAKRARAAAEADKKKLIADTLVRRIFRTGADGRAELKNSVELSHFFAASLRRATEGDKHALEFTDATGKFTLTGDAVCMYHEALKRAAETEGLEVGERTRLEFARALHALHNNKKEAIDAPPALARGLQWLTDSYAGRAALPGGKEGDTAKISGARQLVFTTALGAGVAYAALTDGAAVRIGIGAAYGVLRGQKSQFEADRRRADRESRENLNAVTMDASDLLRKGSEATPDDLALARNYRDLLSALLGGKKFVLPERGATPSRLSKEDARRFGWFSAHSLDAAAFLQRDEKMRKVLESVQREISRSGFLERQATELKPSFTDALRSMKSAGERLSEKAKNSLGVEAGCFFKRGVRSVVYGAIGAGVSWGIGKGALALKHHFAPPGEAVAAVKPEGAAAAAAPAPAEVPPAAPVHTVEFPPGSEVHAEEGITHPVARQLLEKFREDISQNHKPSVMLENGREYQFRGDIHNAKALNDFAVRVSARMAEMKGDIDLKAGTEKWLSFMGEGKGHVVLTQHDGKFGYVIQNELEKEPHPLEAVERQTPVAPEHGRMVGEDWSAKIHLTGETALADKLPAPAGGQEWRDVTAPRPPDINLTLHPASGGASSAGGAGPADVNQVMERLREDIARYDAFNNWAVKDRSVQNYVQAGLITESQLDDMIYSWGKTHQLSASDATHREFLNFIKLEAAKWTPPAGGTEAEAAPSSEEAINAEPESAAPGGAPQAEADEDETAAEDAAPARATAPRAEVPAAFALNADHPVAVVKQGGDRIVHFLDQKSQDKQVVTLLERYSPAPSGEEHNPLFIKLTPDGRPVPARLEMHMVPGNLNPQPVVVLEAAGEGGATEDVFYRVVNKELQKMEEPPSTARLLTI